MKARSFVFLALLLAGCGSDDASGGASVDVGGVYSGPVTNGPNTCPGLWNTGAMNDAMVTVAQMGSSVSIQVKGAAGLLLTAGFGTNSFAGTVTGSHIDASIIGSVSATRGGCVNTSNGSLAADLAANTLSGTIVYTPQTNGHADCATMMVNGCSSQQSFALNRPPKAP
jgi:hypothetical protein